MLGVDYAVSFLVSAFQSASEPTFPKVETMRVSL